MFLSVPALRAFPFSKLFWPSSLNQSFHDPYAPPRTNPTRRVPHPVLIGHDASLTDRMSDLAEHADVVEGRRGPQVPEGVLAQARPPPDQKTQRFVK